MRASLKRIAALTRVRNLEFLRDRASLGWNILVPVLLVLGLAVVFGGPDKPLFKVAVLTDAPTLDAELHPFLGTRFVEFFRVEDEADSLSKVERHQIDMLLDLRIEPPRYWVNSTSPKGYFLERMLDAAPAQGFRRELVEGREIRYVDWLLPGILGMNMMFSCLFGVGYVIVRYRKNGYLKRLSATPLRAFEYIIAQVSSRLMLIMAITVAIFIGTDWIIHFRMEGRYINLFLVTLLGAASMIAMGLTIAARVTSEELAGGLLNLLSLPMMVVSGIWFSLEGREPWLQHLAAVFPLTHLIDAARAIMLDGAGLWQIRHQLLILLGMTVAFLTLGASWFRWRQE
ncbi:MAG: ABC transporter permease [Nevskiales bacterium]